MTDTISALDIASENLAPSPESSTRSTSVRIPVDVHAELTRLAELQGETISGIINACLVEMVAGFSPKDLYSIPAAPAPAQAPASGVVVTDGDAVEQLGRQLAQAAAPHVIKVSCGSGARHEYRDFVGAQCRIESVTDPWREGVKDAADRPGGTIRIEGLPLVCR